MSLSLVDSKNTVYAKGDTCLNITPFDNYRLFTLYDDWKSEDRKPLDLSNGQKSYLVFKSSKKEIRIPEYDISYGGYDVDKVNGQVLFKISKKKAQDILSMDDHTFYITRVFETLDSTGNTVLSSDEEVMYVGKWKDDGSSSVENYTSKLKTLMSQLDDRNAAVSSLQESNAKLMEQNVNLSTQVEDLKSENDRLNQSVSELQSKLNVYESGNVYEGTVVGDATNYTLIDHTSGTYSESAMEKLLKDMANGLVK